MFYFLIVTPKDKIWLIGSSLIHWAEARARKSKAKMEPPHRNRSDMAWTAWHEMEPAAARNKSPAANLFSAHCNMYTCRGGMF